MVTPASPPITPALPASFFMEPSAGSLSFLFLFDFVRSLMSCMSIHHSASLSWLGIVAIWGDWLHLHPSFIDPLPAFVSPRSPRSQPSDEPPPPLSTSTSSSPSAAGVSSPYLDHERVVFTRCWHAFAHACNVLTVAVNSTASDVVEAVQLPDQPPLREELEVYGFSYLSAAYPALNHDFYWRRSDPQSIAELTGAVLKEKEVHSPPSVSASTVVIGSVSGSGSGIGSSSSSSGSVSAIMNGSRPSPSSSSATVSGSSSTSVTLLPPSHKSRAAVSGAGLDRKQYRRAVKVLRFADYLLTNYNVIKQDQVTGHFFVESSDIAESALPLSRVANIPTATRPAAVPPPSMPQPNAGSLPSNNQRLPMTMMPNVGVASNAGIGLGVRSGLAASSSNTNRSSNSANLPIATQQTSRASVPLHAANHISQTTTFTAGSHQHQHHQHQQQQQQPQPHSQAHSQSPHHHHQHQQQQQQTSAMAAINAHIQQQQQQPGAMTWQRTAVDRNASAPPMQPSKHHAVSSSLDAASNWHEAASTNRMTSRPNRPLSSQLNISHSATSAAHSMQMQRSAQQQHQQHVEDASGDIDAVLERRMAEERQRQWKEAEQQEWKRDRENAVNKQTFEVNSGGPYGSHAQTVHGPLKGLISPGHGANSDQASNHSFSSRLPSGASSASQSLTSPSTSSQFRYRPPSEPVQPRSSPVSHPLFGSSSSTRSGDGWENYRGGGAAAALPPTSTTPQPAADDDKVDGGLLRGWTPFDSQSSHPLSFLHQSLFSERGPSIDAFADSDQPRTIQPSANHRSRLDNADGNSNVMSSSSSSNVNHNQPGAAVEFDRRVSSSSPSSRSPSPILYPSHMLSPSSSAQPGALHDSSPPPPGFRPGLLSSQQSHPAWTSRLDDGGSGTGSDSGSGLLSTTGSRGSGGGSAQSDASMSRLSGSSSSSAWSTSIGQQLTSAYSRSLQSFSEPGGPNVTDARSMRERYAVDHHQYDDMTAEADWAMMDSADRLDQPDIPIGLDELLDDDDEHTNNQHNQTYSTHQQHQPQQRQQQQQEQNYSPHSSAYKLTGPPRSHLQYDFSAASHPARESQPPASSSSSPHSSGAQPYRPPHLQPHRQPPLPRTQALPPSTHPTSQQPPHQQHQQQQGGRTYR